LPQKNRNVCEKTDTFRGKTQDTLAKSFLT